MYNGSFETILCQYMLANELYANDVRKTVRRLNQIIAFSVTLAAKLQRVYSHRVFGARINTFAFLTSALGIVGIYILR